MFLLVVTALHLFTMTMSWRVCEISEVNGFLKQKCTISELNWSLYQCSYSNEYYYILPKLTMQTSNMFNSSCSNDPGFYQVCGSDTDFHAILTSPTSNGSSTTAPLCGFIVCNQTGWYSSARLISIVSVQQYCDNADLGCTNLAAGEVECHESDNHQGEVTQASTVCNSVCDTDNCVDESYCNGLQYGFWCGKLSYHPYYVPAIHLCTQYYTFSVVCPGITIDNCTVDPGSTHKNNLTVCPNNYAKGNYFNERDVPIFNYTRCAIMFYPYPQSIFTFIGTHPRYYPYCTNYLDQTNCTDRDRVAVRCNIAGHGISSLSKVMVCGGINYPLCDNGIDLKCLEFSSGCRVHKHLLCDGHNDCQDGIDENYLNCTEVTREKCWRVYRHQGSLPIPRSWLHDGVMDCLDGEDEEEGRWKSCGSGVTTRYVLDDWVCRDVFLCRNSDRPFIEMQDLCDGVESCGSEYQICKAALGKRKGYTHLQRLGHATSLMYCRKGLANHHTYNKCGTKSLNPFNEEVFGMSHNIISYPIVSKVSCKYVFGEAYVLLSCLNSCLETPCILPRRISHQDCPKQFPNRIKTIVNNAYLTFVTRHPGEGYHNNYFICDDGTCLEYSKVCDLVTDCRDASDEASCVNSFRCKENRDSFIFLSQVCDGHVDCADSSDECNTKCGIHILASSFLRVSAWTIGIISIIFNIVVIIENGCQLFECKSSTALTNKLLVMVISVGDLIVGVYLISLAIFDLIYGEEYCKMKSVWLSGAWCSGLGVISTFGSLTSLFSLTGLSLARAWTVAKETLLHENHDARFRDIPRTWIFLTVLYLAGLAISLIPLISLLEDFFVNGLVYDRERKLFSQPTDKEKFFEVITTFYGRAKRGTLSWKSIKKLVSGMYSNEYTNVDDTVRTVGFYGNSGVCLFKFFVNHNDPQRVFTLLVLVINIVCMFVVAVSYIFITVKTIKGSSSLVQQNGELAKTIRARNAKLQRKIAIIIGTDLVCWIPFIIASGLHYFEVIDATPTYGIFSIVILPLNAIINPFLYSTKLTEWTLQFISLVKMKINNRIGPN